MSETNEQKLPPFQTEKPEPITEPQPQVDASPNSHDNTQELKDAKAQIRELINGAKNNDWQKYVPSHVKLEDRRDHELPLDLMVENLQQMPEKKMGIVQSIIYLIRKFFQRKKASQSPDPASISQ